MAQNFGGFSARCAGFVSALSVGLLSVVSDSSAKSQSMAGANSCPEPAVVVQNDAVAPVTKATFAAAETQTVFAKYIAKIAKETCTGGMGVLWNDSRADDPKDRTVFALISTRCIHS